MNFEVIFTPEAEEQIVNLHRYITEQAGQLVADGYTDSSLFCFFSEVGYNVFIFKIPSGIVFFYHL